MSGHAALELQKAVVDALTAALLTAGPGGAAVPVKTHVKEDQAKPYVVAGEGTAGEFDTSTEVGQEHELLLHFYDDTQRSSKLLRQLMKAAYDALNQVALTVSGAQLVDLRWELDDVALEPDGLTFHGVQRYRAFTTE